MSYNNDKNSKPSIDHADPTANIAIANVEREEARFHRLLHTLFYICKLANFEIAERIVLIDKTTGKIWR